MKSAFFSISLVFYLLIFFTFVSCKSRVFNSQLKQNHSATGLDSDDLVSLSFDPNTQKYFLSKGCEAPKFEVTPKQLMENFLKEIGFQKHSKNFETLESVIKQRQSVAVEKRTLEEQTALKILDEQLQQDRQNFEFAIAQKTELGALFNVTTSPVCIVQSKFAMTEAKNFARISVFEFLSRQLAIKKLTNASATVTTATLAKTQKVINLRAHDLSEFNEIGIAENSLKALQESQGFVLKLAFGADSTYQFRGRKDYRWNHTWGASLVFQDGLVLDSKTAPYENGFVCVLAIDSALLAEHGEAISFAAGQELIFKGPESRYREGFIEGRTLGEQLKIGLRLYSSVLVCGTVSYDYKNVKEKTGLFQSNTVKERTGKWNIINTNQSIYGASLIGILPEDIGVFLVK